MLHIGETQVNLGMPNAKVLYFGETKMGPIIGESGEPTPGGTVLHLYDRVDGKATVAGFWTDGNGQRYAVCVVDAQYRSGKQYWSIDGVDTLLTNYNDSNILSASESGTWNTDTILNNYNVSRYPAFNFARNACTVTVDNKQFTSCLPNARELYNISKDKETLDSYDTTASSYSDKSLSSWFNNTPALTSNEYNYDRAYYCSKSSSIARYGRKSTNYYGVIPIFEIPVDENGTVITI